MTSTSIYYWNTDTLLKCSHTHIWIFICFPFTIGRLSHKLWKCANALPKHSLAIEILTHKNEILSLTRIPEFSLLMFTTEKVSHTTEMLSHTHCWNGFTHAHTTVICFAFTPHYWNAHTHNIETLTHTYTLLKRSHTFYWFFSPSHTQLKHSHAEMELRQTTLVKHTNSHY